MATKKQSYSSDHSWTGKNLPALKVTLGDESVVPLKTLLPKDEWSVLYFYPRDNTPGCNQEAKDFQAALRKLKSKNVNVVGVSADSPASHQKFVKKFDLKFPLISDEDKKLCERMETWQLKSFMGKKFMGIVRSTFLLKGHKILRVWQPVRVKEHVNDVLESITELKKEHK